VKPKQAKVDSVAREYWTAYYDDIDPEYGEELVEDLAKKAMIDLNCQTKFTGLVLAKNHPQRPTQFILEALADGRPVKIAFNKAGFYKIIQAQAQPPANKNAQVVEQIREMVAALKTPLLESEMRKLMATKRQIEEMLHEQASDELKRSAAEDQLYDVYCDDVLEASGRTREEARALIKKLKAENPHAHIVAYDMQLAQNLWKRKKP